MREILFRGKRIDNEEWVYGDLVQSPAHKVVQIFEQDLCGDNFSVYPKSVGQYTGKTDKNGKNVFTDDIVTCGFDNLRGIVRFGEYSNPTADDYHIGFYIEWEEEYRDNLRKDLGYWTKVENFKVIGNIYDNPGLMRWTNERSII